MRTARATADRGRAARAGSSCRCAAGRRRTTARRSVPRGSRAASPTRVAAATRSAATFSNSARVTTRPSVCSCASASIDDTRRWIRLGPARPFGFAEIVEPGRSPAWSRAARRDRDRPADADRRRRRRTGSGAAPNRDARARRSLLPPDRLPADDCHERGSHLSRGGESLDTPSDVAQHRIAVAGDPGIRRRRSRRRGAPGGR